MCQHLFTCTFLCWVVDGLISLNKDVAPVSGDQDLCNLLAERGTLCHKVDIMHRSFSAEFKVPVSV